jgi:hypothetical protein
MKVFMGKIANAYFAYDQQAREKFRSFAQWVNSHSTLQKLWDDEWGYENYPAAQDGIYNYLVNSDREHWDGVCEYLHDELLDTLISQQKHQLTEDYSLPDLWSEYGT